MRVGRFSLRMGLLSLGILIWLISSCTVGGTRCSSAEDCPPAYRYCIKLECKECISNQDCKAPKLCWRGSCRKPTQINEEKEVKEGSKQAKDAGLPEPSESTTIPDSSPPEKTSDIVEKIPEQPTEQMRDDRPDTPGKTCSPKTTRSCYSGPATTQDKGNCKSGQQICLLAKKWGACLNQVLPKPEICFNKQDDDCDGQIDENCGVCKEKTKRSCYNHKGTGCIRNVSSFSCKGSCKAGTETCTKGKWSPCIGAIAPSAEDCDNLDNDCDGRIDEDFPLKGKVCFVGVGGCRRSSKFICGKGRALRCPAIPAQPIKETCSPAGIDEDCDGQVDETCPCKTGQTQACGSSIGACRTGTNICQLLKWSTLCRSQIRPRNETCDGKDNNCDGQIDEGCCLPTKQKHFWSPIPPLASNPPIGLYFGIEKLGLRYKNGPRQTWNVSGNAPIKTGSSTQFIPGTASTGFRHIAIISLASSTTSQTPRLLVILNGKTIYRSTFHTKEITSLDLTATPIEVYKGDKYQAIIAAGSKDGTITTYKARKTEVKRDKKLKGHVGEVNDVAVDSEGKKLVSGGQDKTVRIWDTRKESPLFTLTGHKAPVVSVAYAPNGKLVASASMDRSIKLWNPTTGRFTKTLFVAASPVYPTRVKFDPKGAWIAAGFSNGKVRIWDAQNYAIRATLTQVKKSIAFIDWTPIQTIGIKTLPTMLAASNSEGKVIIWKCK